MYLIHPMSISFYTQQGIIYVYIVIVKEEGVGVKPFIWSFRDSFQVMRDHFFPLSSTIMVTICRMAKQRIGMYHKGLKIYTNWIFMVYLFKLSFFIAFYLIGNGTNNFIRNNPKGTVSGQRAHTCRCDQPGYTMSTIHSPFKCVLLLFLLLLLLREIYWDVICRKIEKVKINRCWYENWKST